MKKKVLFFFFFFVNILMVEGQNALPYKSLNEFEKDTTAFVVYNFMERAEVYKGKTLRDVVSDLKIPVIDVTWNYGKRGTVLNGINLYIYVFEYADWLTEQEREDNVISIIFEIPTTYLENDVHLSWNEVYDLYKDMKLKEIYVIIPEFSKYNYLNERFETRAIKPNKRVLNFNF